MTLTNKEHEDLSETEEEQPENVEENTDKVTNSPFEPAVQKWKFQSFQQANPMTIQTLADPQRRQQEQLQRQQQAMQLKQQQQNYQIIQQHMLRVQEEQLERQRTELRRQQWEQELTQLQQELIELAKQSPEWASRECSQEIEKEKEQLSLERERKIKLLGGKSRYNYYRNANFQACNDLKDLEDSIGFRKEKIKLLSELRNKMRAKWTGENNSDRSGKIQLPQNAVQQVNQTNSIAQIQKQYQQQPQLLQQQLQQLQQLHGIGQKQPQQSAPQKVNQTYPLAFMPLPELESRRKQVLPTSAHIRVSALKSERKAC